MIDEKTIVQKTYKLYSKYGIKSVSIDEIVVKLGISKKTLYMHIKGKDELIEKVVEYSMSKFIQELNEFINLEKNAIRKLALFFAYMVKNARKINPSFFFDLKRMCHNQYKEIENFRDEKLFVTVKSIVDEGISNGFFRDEIDLEYVFQNMIFKVSDAAYRVFPAYRDAKSDNTIYKLLLNDILGITSLKGHREFDKRYDDLLAIL
ncbi:TetR/AcrR family transcriptional regulator [Sunxiuqinia sp. A32]|uniref:TetR/AcrR family transcriptional regulator n=1 Tax=Sunxiuqinia sp. A32 TaxID=3461496 RepID=UPI004045E50B